MAPDELDRCAKSWMNWASEPPSVAVAMVAKGARIDATVVAANIAAISERACFLQSEDAKRRRDLRRRIEASRKGAVTRARY